ncbi:MAG: hypothetical protein HYW56_01540 [Candidatus Harrisonbacteria bacterium]|nr:hypothetical protein [Candidatus Harrisonbacteria bacterium]
MEWWILASVIYVAGLVMLYRGKVAMAKGRLPESVCIMVSGAITVVVGMMVVPTMRIAKLRDRVAALEAQLAKPAAGAPVTTGTESK